MHLLKNNNNNNNKFELINTPDVPTFYRANLARASVINLAFATIDMSEKIRN
jgi:hypothetical protein